MDASITTEALAADLGTSEAPLVIDVRRVPAWLDATDWIACALRRDPIKVAQWAGELPTAVPIVVYCVHGHQVSQSTAAALRALGYRARFLAGGIEGWKNQGLAVRTKPHGASTRWITRARPKIDRIACPWLVARFVDHDAEVHYVPASDVASEAPRRDAIVFDVEGAPFGHQGERCSFDAFVATFGLQRDPALARVATIVRGADTDHVELASESAGLLAISRGLSLHFDDDHAMLRHGMTMYDALYRWAASHERAADIWRMAPP